MRTHRQPSASIRRLLADNLIRLRAARGLTQLELAAACGLSNAYISKIERELINPSLANLEALTVGLDCAPADLLIRVRAAAPRDIRRSPRGSAE
jgi:transcriptional regulator with XRE-family HTH domain